MMKLLLTSNGLSNQTITQSLVELIEQPAEGTKLAFVPTAANVEEGNKDWLINDLNNCQKPGFEVDIVDISALRKEQWLPRLKQAKVLFFSGGNTFHLMHWMNKSGLAELLPELLQTRVYAGISAGSCVTGPTIYNSVQNLTGEKYELEIKNGLAMVDFHFIPHLNSPYFDQIRKEKLEIAAQDLPEPVYALDDNSALVVTDNNVEVITEGQWYKFD